MNSSLANKYFRGINCTLHTGMKSMEKTFWTAKDGCCYYRSVERDWQGYPMRTRDEPAALHDCIAEGCMPTHEPYAHMGLGDGFPVTEETLAWKKQQQQKNATLDPSRLERWDTRERVQQWLTDSRTTSGS